ncbi:unnamed protein product, partial [Mesorhabditis spiculigera]
MLTLARREQPMPTVLQLFRNVFSGRYKLAANTGVSCGILGSADALQQLIQGSWDPRDPGRPWDWRRTGRFAACGLLQGPMLHFMYRFMDFHVRFRGPRLAVALQKCAIDVSSAPLFTVTTICGVGLMEGHTLREGLAEYRRKFIHIFMLDCVTWPPFQFVNFMFLPPQFRVVYTNMVQLLYNMLISYIKHNNELGRH